MIDKGGFKPSKGGKREFTLFPELPIELRLKIWTYSLPDPRIVKIIDHEKWGNHDQGLFEISCQSPKINMLQIDSKSRFIVLSNYSPQFDEIDAKPIDSTINATVCL